MFKLLRRSSFNWIFAEVVPLIFYYWYKYWRKSDFSKAFRYDYGDYDTGYGLSSADKKDIIYPPYLVALETSMQMVRKVSPQYDHGFKTLRDKPLPSDLSKSGFVGYILWISVQIRIKLARINNYLLRRS
jgi:hypothetical protein